MVEVLYCQVNDKPLICFRATATNALSALAMIQANRIHSHYRHVSCLKAQTDDWRPVFTFLRHPTGSSQTLRSYKLWIGNNEISDRKLINFHEVRN
jgi:hypothetical protein